MDVLQAGGKNVIYNLKTLMASLWMTYARVTCAALLLAGVGRAAEVGEGAPNSGVQQAFVQAWLRNGFNRLVQDPTGNVIRYGSAGFIQQFPPASGTGGNLALIKPDSTGTLNVAQVQAAMFAYYGSIGSGPAGYPAHDTLSCPELKTSANSGNSCQWQGFTNKYALFVYASPLGNGSQNFATRDPFFTKWTSMGGIEGLGPANSTETEITTKYTTTANLQSFDQGAIYNITSGQLNGKIFAVREPVYSLYVANGAHNGTLGTPTSEELVLANGMLRQSFEAGAIDYDPKTRVPVLRPPVDRISISPSGAVQLNAGEAINAAVILYGNDGGLLTDRVVAWTSSNGRVVQVTSNGLTASLRAVGAGTATVIATSEGRTSVPITITVIAPCCQIGEGAPTAGIRQAFQDAITRNRLSVQLPAASVAARIGGGYVQQFLTAGPTPAAVLVAVKDGTSLGYVVMGALLSAYMSQGGVGGALGYPTSDATAGGRQLFERGALAGNPVRAVSGAILTKWASLGYETGSAGPPVEAAGPFLSFQGTTGIAQTFQNAAIVAITSGALNGRAFLVAGPILVKYTSTGGPTGSLGAPTGDERLSGAIRQQDFEGGSVTYPPGSAEATIVPRPRQPGVSATPGSVLSGSVVHLTVGGFADGATLRVSQSGQADFVVRTANGSYSWDVRIPGAAATGTVIVRAVDTDSSASAQASYAVRNAAATALDISIVSGDRQDGVPGAMLLQPLVVAVKDLNGVPAPGVTVTFAASAGTRLEPTTAVTDQQGMASATLRMANAAGIVLATATAARQVVTFSARAVAASLVNFPAVTQEVDGTLGNGTGRIREKGAMLAAVTSILRFYQLRGELPQPFGLADVSALNQFLKTLCTTDSAGNRICDGFVSSGEEQIVNLWRLGAFVANSVDVQVEPADMGHLRDLSAAGYPVLLALSVTGKGSHFVVLTGVAADGSLVVADPYSALGVSLASTTITGAVRLLPTAPASPGFLAAGNSSIDVASASGRCEETLQFPQIAAVAGVAGSPDSKIYFRHCGGSADSYQLDAAPSAVFTDLNAAGARTVLSAASYEVNRQGSQWTLAPVRTRITPGGIVNAASFTAEMSPGGLATLFGAGLGKDAQISIGGSPATVLAGFPFQINFRVPIDSPPGAAALKLTSPNGSVEQSIALQETAPAIFFVGTNQAAITNQDNSLNTASNPAARGSFLVIYSTGFGAVNTSGNLSRARVPVIAVIGGTEVGAAFAGLTPGAIGLYQANVQIPVALPPGLSLPLFLKQGTSLSNTVRVAIQ